MENINMADAEYQDWLRSQKCNGNCDECQCEGKSATQEEVQTQHDAWWNSLTDEQKQQLYFNQTEADKDHINHWIKREDV